MIQYFATHRTAANILMVIICFLGIKTAPNLLRETFPRNKLESIQVSIVYPGASALEVESDVCLAVENAIDGISGIDEIQCKAYENRASVIVEKLENADFSRLIVDVKTKLDSIKNFPDAVEKPIVEERQANDPVVSLALTSNLNSHELRHFAEQIRDELKEDLQVKLIKIEGFSQSQFQITFDEGVLRSLSLSIQDVTDIISKQNINMPAGELQSSTSIISIRMNNQIKNLKDLGKIIIKKAANGKEILLSEVATIISDFEDPEEQSNFNGVPAAILKIEKEKSEDSILILKKIQNYVEQKNKTFPLGTKLYVTDDKTSIVQERLELITLNGLQGLILVCIVLYFFFGWNFAFWVSMGLPVSFLGGLYFMSHLDISINMISLVGLLLGIGLLMDDAIVLSENIAAQRQKGLTPKDAAIGGAKQVLTGVISSFLTTVVMFGGMCFLDGDIGRILKVMPMVLILILSVSLVEGFLILPNHLIHALEKEEQIVFLRKLFIDAFESFKLNILKPFVRRVVHYRYLCISITTITFVLAVSLLINGSIKFQVLPALEGDIMVARLMLNQGTPFEVTKTRVEQIIKGLKTTNDKYMKEYNSVAPLVENIRVDYAKNTDVDEKGSHVATVSVDLLESSQRKMRLLDIIQSWKDHTGIIYDLSEVNFKEPSFGPSGSPIHVRLFSNDLNSLEKASDEYKMWLSKYVGVQNIMDDLRYSKREMSLRLRPGALSLGVTAKAVSSQLRAAFQGAVADEVYYLNKNYEISVRLNKNDKTNLSQLKNHLIITQEGKKIPLSELVSFSMGRSFSKITRVDGQRVVNITANINSRVVNADELTKLATHSIFKDFATKYPNIKIKLEGEAKSSIETGGSMRIAFLSGILGVILLLIFQFGTLLEPLIIISAIPLALIGVLFGHFALGYDFTMPSTMGFISLAGIVVNDSILLVEFIRMHWTKGQSLEVSIIDAVMDRFRPIFLTSLTTIVGTAPLLFETSLQVQILIPLVISLIFGMLSATLLILFVIPSVYMILNDFGLLKGRVDLDS
ncbi:MAG: efflux RND transporter permease subunit [Candidatus Cloacimonetes bacterium]|nr:efflux RND transporter permease subunit [Candidatus Cloacimonadota bacterium]